jgi:hypothetical protein
MAALSTGHNQMRFLRAPAGYLRRHLGDQVFKARSADRDAETDRLRMNSILEAIESQLGAAEQEQAGLVHRVEDVLARAALTLGNGTDEYLEREALDSRQQDLFGIEIANGQRRLRELAITIARFKSLRAAALGGFQDHQPI